MTLTLLLTLLGFTPSPALAAEIDRYHVEYSTSTAPIIIAAYAHKAGVGKDTELLQRIAYCESKYIADAKGYNKQDGKVWSVDRGPFQINDYYHPRIDDPFDNIEYGVLLYKKMGAQPWNASKHCWGILG